MTTALHVRLLNVLAFLAWLALPERVTASWRWCRRTFGGRWSRGHDGRRWRPVKACPGPMWSELLGGEPVRAGVCFDDPVTGESACHCEVWP